MIPRRIYQTWKTKDRATWSWHLRRWVRTWERKNPGYTHQVADDDDCLALVEEHFPEHVEAYRSLLPVEKADCWRVMVLYAFGGVYADIDTKCALPVDRWLRSDDRVVIGLESDFIDVYPDWKPTHTLKSGGVYNNSPHTKWNDNVVMFCNWAFASEPGHELFADVIRRIAINATDPFFLGGDWTIKKTGPGALTDAVNDYLEAHQSSPAAVAHALRTRPDHRVGEIRFLDYDAFHTRFVCHQGLGTWKPLSGPQLWRRLRAYWS